MTLDQLRCFVTVAECLNMTRAAQFLHLSQPAVSAAVAALESRHAIPLFDRIGRRLELTEGGKAFLPEAKAVLRRADDAKRILNDLSGLLSGRLRLFASQTVATYWLPPHMASFAARHPSIELSLGVGNTTQARNAILSGEADLGFVEGQAEETGIVATPVGGDSLGIYGANGHPLVGRPIYARELRDAAWVVRESGSGTRDHFILGLREFDLSLSDLNVRLEFPSNGAALEAVKASHLVAAISDLAAASRLSAGQLQRLDCEFPPRTFKMIFHRDRYLSRAAGAFASGLPN